MRRDEQDQCPCTSADTHEGGEGADRDQQQDGYRPSGSEWCRCAGREQGQSRYCEKTEKKGNAALPGAEEVCHAGLTPILRSINRAPTPTMVTSIAASREPAIKAAHMSIVWL